MTRWTRRQFITASVAGIASLARSAPVAAGRGGAGAMPMRPLGRTGCDVSLLGLGGFHVGVDSLTDAESVRLIRTAIDGGVNFLDNAREYNNGRSEERVGLALKDGWRSRVLVMTKNCAHTRDGAETMRDLEASLRALRTDHLDLMLFHEVVYDNDPDWIMSRGALAAAIRARKQGKVRFIGFSGHKLPAIHQRMLSLPFHWDAVMLPLNIFDAHFRSFQKEVLPELNRRQIGSIAFKTLTGFMSDMLSKTGIPASECLRYVMSLPISTAVVGMESLDLLKKNLALMHGFQPMSEDEKRAILARSSPFAGDGRFERYKTGLHFEGDAGLAAHDFKRP